MLDPARLVPPHRISVDRFRQLLDHAGFRTIRIRPLSFHDRFVELEHLWRWNQSSCFGNFLPHLEINGPLQRHLVFAWACKPGREPGAPLRAS